MSKAEGSKQSQILQCIYDYLDEHGYPPTVREICEAVDLSSTSTVHGHLSRLEKKVLFNVTLLNLGQSNLLVQV
jgi:SOS-response transcriptional repressors (RecA-mediated autopeptidases)